MATQLNHLDLDRLFYTRIDRVARMEPDFGLEAEPMPESKSLQQPGLCRTGALTRA